MNFISDGASLTQVAFLVSEGTKFAGVLHANIQSPLAISTITTGVSSPKIAYPYSPGANLKL